MNPLLYTIVRKSNRKTASIVVRPGGMVEVRVPSFVSDQEVETLVNSKQVWIKQKLDTFNNTEYHSPQHLFATGEQFPILGIFYSLKVVNGRTNISLQGETILVSVPDGLSGSSRVENIKTQLADFFSAMAVKILREKSGEYSKKYNLHPVYISAKNYRSRWGCCYSDGRILFNWRIILAPEAVVDYVVAHEICHLQEQNHSTTFWRLVEREIPDWKERRAWLRLNGHALNF